MKIYQTLASYDGFSVKLFVTDNSDSNYANFVKTYKDTVNINYSVFLNLISSKWDSPESRKKSPNKADQSEFVAFSIFDMYELKATFNEVAEILTSEYYEEYDHPDKGTILRLLPEYKGYFREVTNITNSGQIGIGLKFIVSRETREYIPAVVICVRTDESAIVIDARRFLGICDLINNVDLHASARGLIQTAVMSANLRRAATQRHADTIQFQES